MALQWVTLQVISLLSALQVALTSAQALPGCLDRCGSVNIPYPFGTRGGCYIEEQFLITCNGTSPPMAFLTTSNISVTDISLDNHQLRVLTQSSYACYDENNQLTSNFRYWIGLAKFPISNTRNKFTAVGCKTLATVGGSRGRDYTTGCLSLCSSINSTINGSCSGIGCCEAKLPKDIRSFEIEVTSYYEDGDVSTFNPCSYAFVVEDGNYTFSSTDLLGLRNREEIPVILDWAIGDQPCKKVKDSPDYACKENSYCEDSDNGPGYRCHCSQGYEGNPYLPGGCKDINECERYRPCNITSGCHNFAGSYNCSCPQGYEGDGFKNGTGCSAITDKSQSTPLVNIALGISVSLLALFLGASWLYWWLRQRNLIKLREKFFQENGGIMLQQRLSQRQGSAEVAKIFKAEELKKATNNYHESTILGQGGQGTVYKGILPDNRIVAIKKSKVVDKSQVEQFINEVIVLSQINHRNVVKLLGCCLETEVPLLVYEFISNGTLDHHIHNAALASSITWDARLRIAAETAGALSYLHSAASTPIVHRDVKSTNILLDDHYTAKVSDFGASKFIPLDQTQLTTLVQGTLGYLDPEYFHSSQLTEKSDVYSFGVVLVELLTGRVALSFEMPEKDRNLAMCFVTALKEDRLVEIIDQVLHEADPEQLREVAVLAKRCLRLKGEERPTMKEVAMELEGLRVMMKHPRVQDDVNLSEETEYLLGEISNSSLISGVVNSNMSGYDSSIRNQVMLPFGDGR